MDIPNILHGLDDEEIAGKSVVLTLKDQPILVNQEINQEIDVLENVEIAEQKQRGKAYRDAIKQNSSFDDLGSDSEEKLSSYMKGKHFESLSSSQKFTSSDYYSHEELVQLEKPKKKSLRKKEKLDIDALEAEAFSAGLGEGDLGSRVDGKRESIRLERERCDHERRRNAYKSAQARAKEACNALRFEQNCTTRVFAVDDDDDIELRKSLERARKLALKKQDEAASGTQALALAAASIPAGDQHQEQDKVVFTEMEEFVRGHQIGEEQTCNPDKEDCITEENMEPESMTQEEADHSDEGKTNPPMEGDEKIILDEVKTNAMEGEEKIVLDQTIREVEIGKGLSGTLRLLKDRGALDKGVHRCGEDVQIRMTDEFGKVLPPKKEFNILSHRFHGKFPGKKKQEKLLKEKEVQRSDTLLLSVEGMRKAQAAMKTPYLVLSGNVKPSKSFDVKKDLDGGLTPTVGDRKVSKELKRRAEPWKMVIQKKPKTVFCRQ